MSVSLQCMPLDIFEMIISNLTGQCIANLSLTCQYIKKFELWDYYVKNVRHIYIDYDIDDDQLQKLTCNRRIEVLKLYNCNNLHTCSYNTLSLMHHLQHLYIATYLNYKNDNNSKLLKNIYFPNLKSLHCDDDFIDHWSDLKCPCIKKLEINGKLKNNYPPDLMSTLYCRLDHNLDKLCDTQQLKYLSYKDLNFFFVILPHDFKKKIIKSNLEYFEISNCCGDSENLKYIINRCNLNFHPQLKTLVLMNINIGNNLIRKIFINCLSVQHIVLRNLVITNDAFRKTMNLKLISIDVRGCINITQKSIKILMERHHDTLKSIKLCHKLYHKTYFETPALFENNIKVILCEKNDLCGCEEIS